MKTIQLLLLAAISMSSLQPVSAMPPLPPRPLEQRVKDASHVFVGTARKLTVVNSQGVEVKDEPRMLNFDQYIVLEVEVQEVLSPVSWKPSERIKVPYGGGMFEIEEMRYQFIDKPAIYLTTIEVGDKSGPYYHSTYSYFLTVSLGKKAEVQQLIQPYPYIERVNRMEWLGKCMKDVDAIKIGNTRQEIERNFFLQEDSTNTNTTRYYHRECPFLRIDVEFVPSNLPNRHNLDEVKAVSKPFLEWISSS